MKIYIMRHGQAGMNAKTDEQRPLTEQGIEESIHMAGWLACLPACLRLPVL